MPELPVCGNYTAGTCERSSVYLSKETDHGFVITCRTCKSISVWPKEKEEGAGRYQAWLKHMVARTAQARYESSRPDYSFADHGEK